MHNFELALTYFSVFSFGDITERRHYIHDSWLCDLQICVRQTSWAVGRYDRTGSDRQIYYTVALTISMVGITNMEQYQVQMVVYPNLPPVDTMTKGGNSTGTSAKGCMYVKRHTSAEKIAEICRKNSAGFHDQSQRWEQRWISQPKVERALNLIGKGGNNSGYHNQKCGLTKCHDQGRIHYQR